MFLEAPSRVIVRENDSLTLQCLTNGGVHSRINWFFYERQISVGEEAEKKMKIWLA